MFYSDRPIFKSEDDLLSRSGFAKKLAHMLMQFKTEDTFTLGLFGKWGSGKTSLINMMLQEIAIAEKNLNNEDKLIVVHFEPWIFSDTNQLLSQFFVRLSNEFRSKSDENLIKIGEAIEKYSDAFDLAKAIPKIGDIVALLGKIGTADIAQKLKKGSDEKDVQKQKENVVSILREQPNRILIIIDDIDRLNNEQIRQVFQLVTSVARFPKTTYLLSFDKEVVVEALKEVQKGDGEEYLEKIIQIPIEIPQLAQNKVNETLVKRLNNIISEYNGIYFETGYWEKISDSCIEPFVKNLRDVNRLCNAVNFKLSTIASEVNFVDLVAITTIEIFLPEVYDWIKNNKSILTGLPNMKKLSLKENTKEENCEIYTKQIDSIIKRQNNSYSQKLKVDLIMDLLSALFPYFGSKIGKSYEVPYSNIRRKDNKISHYDKFDRYFALDIESISVMHSEIEGILHIYDSDKIADILLDKDRNQSSYELLEELRVSVEDIKHDKNRVKTILFALLSCSDKLNSNSKYHYLSLSSSRYADYVIIDLIKVLPKEERFLFFSKLISISSIDLLSKIATIINMIELAYGRLAANGKEEDEHKIITLKELEKLEIVFVERMKKVLESANLFDCDYWRMAAYMLEKFDKDYYEEYIKETLRNDINILKFLSSSIVVWIGSGKQYEIQDTYKKHLSDETILKAIRKTIEQGSFITLPLVVQEKTAAFYLYKINKTNYSENVNQSDVDVTINKWKNHIIVPLAFQ